MSDTEKVVQESTSWPPDWAVDVLLRLDHFREDAERIKEELSHIEKLYSIEDIMRQYRSGSYNSELLLQHSMLLLLEYRGLLNRTK